MKVLCAWIAIATLLTGVAVAINEQDYKYVIQFILGAVFVLLIWTVLL